MPAIKQPFSVRALKLPARERMGLAALLIDSLVETPGVDKVLLKELKTRANDLRSGKVKGLTTQKAYGFSL